MTTQIPPSMLDANSLAMICDHNRLINGDMRIDQLQSGNGEVGLIRNSNRLINGDMRRFLNE